MPEKTQKQLIQEVHQGIYGVPHTEERGVLGDIKDIKTAIKEQNGRVRRNSKLIYVIIGVLMGTGVLGGLEIADVIHLVGG